MPENKRRFDVIYPRPYEKKDGQRGTDWLRVGVAYEGERNFTIILYAMPVGGTETPGETRLLLKESDGREQRGRQQGGPVVERRGPPQQRRLEPQVEGWNGPPDPPDDLPF